MRTLEIFSKVDQYLNGEISLSELQDWFVPRLGLFLSRHADPARELAGVVEFGFAQMSSSQIDEANFRRLLEEFLQSPPSGDRKLDRTA